MISYLFSDDKNQSTNPSKQFLSEKQYDLSLNNSEVRQNSNESIGFPSSSSSSTSYKSSSDSLFTLDKEEYLSNSYDSGNKYGWKEYKKYKEDNEIKRRRELKYDEKYDKSPTPTKFYELLQKNKELVDNFKKQS